MRKYFTNVNAHVIQTQAQFIHLGFVMSWLYRPDGRDKWCVEIATNGHCVHIEKLTQNEAKAMCRELADHVQTYEEAMRK